MAFKNVLILVVGVMSFLNARSENIDTAQAIQLSLDARIENLENDILLERIEQLEMHLSELKKSQMIIDVDWTLISPVSILIPNSALYVIFFAEFCKKAW